MEISDTARETLTSLIEELGDSILLEYDSCGICFGCGDITIGGVEPDAEGYQCEGCQAHKVCGIEQAAICYL